jgi:methylenetetrahydrofolate reductase (NADPH)
MKLSDILKNRVALSFEVFPPKRTAPIQTVYDTLDALTGLNPDFISVTYGAGGSGNGSATCQIASAIKNEYHTESLAHLPCAGLSREEVLAQLEQFRQNGIENILALRGDITDPLQPDGDFLHASDMIAFLKEHGDFNITAACYPEGHPESENLIEDIRNLKKKVDAGADQLITQLFFNNDSFYRFQERCTLAGIHVPIEAGIMPVVNKKQIERMVSLCHVELPEKFITMMNRYENNPAAMRDAGIAYAINQIVDLVAHGVDGIHLYTMNNPYIATKIYDAVYRLIAA